MQAQSKSKRLNENYLIDSSANDVSREVAVDFNETVGAELETSRDVAEADLN